MGLAPLVRGSSFGACPERSAKRLGLLRDGEAASANQLGEGNRKFRISLFELGAVKAIAYHVLPTDLVGLGEGVKIVEPDNIKENMRDFLDGIQKMYKK